MRFLHTADWHVGKTLRGRSRMDEFAAALEEVAGIAIDRKVDAVLIAGDVFDSPAPPPEAERLVYDFLARLLPEQIACVLIAGNHDHPRKLAALARLLEGLRIHVRAEVRPPGQGGVVGLASRDGKEEARVAVLPFVPERKVFDACAVMGPERQWYDAYSERIEQILALLTADLGPSTVNLVLAHALVAGARVGTGERPLHLGDVYGLTAQQLPGNVQYIGLGHLHRPQELMAPSKAAYAGSLVELDFGEVEQEKRAVIVEAAPGRAASLESVAITSGRRLRDVSGTLEELREVARSVADAFLRVTVRAEGPLPGIAEQVRELLPNALDVEVDYPRAAPGVTSEKPRGLGHEELFRDFYRRRNAAEPAEELLALLREVHEEASRP
jgi:DNA repair protein SbcD/Mre11